MKKIYIAGCGGMLGEAFYKQFSNSHKLKCTDIDLNEQWLDYLDFRDYNAYEKDVIAFQPDFLFHLGAYTDLEYCELNPDDTYITNTLCVEHAVHIANELNIPLLYISTAGIYDGKKNEYDDWDSPNPLGVYARSKYFGELFVKDNAKKYYICRAGWMMGGGPQKDKKFILKLLKKIKAGDKELFIVNDKLGTPTYTHDFAKNTLSLIQTNYYGIYNMVCEGTTNRLEVAHELLNLLELQDNIAIREVSSDYYNKEYFAIRPASERLLNVKIKLRGLNNMRDWTICLEEYIKLYYQNYLQE
jgi:dTDP-4-dehydrorhamnose reductase